MPENKFENFLLYDKELVLQVFKSREKPALKYTFLVFPAVFSAS
jgi:hypothetical protein